MVSGALGVQGQLTEPAGQSPWLTAESQVCGKPDGLLGKHLDKTGIRKMVQAKTPRISAQDRGGALATGNVTSSSRME